MNKYHRRSAWAALAFAFLFACYLPQTSTPDQTDLVDLEALQSNGMDWKVDSQSLGRISGQVTLKQDFWLMYFLHWRPIPENGESITFDYARNHLLNFWGPNMPFTLTGDTGWTTINGHRAAMVEATIYEGRIKTRFYVWNCPETGRQFTSDCNINKAVGTPEWLLQMEDSVTQTVRCHDYQKTPDCGEFQARYVSDEFKVSFCKPSAWATSVYNSDEWSPDGASEQSGTLWTLPTDGQRRVELSYVIGKGPSGLLRLRHKLEELPIDTSTEKIGLVSIRIDTLYETDGKYRADGFLIRADTGRGEAWTTESKFSAFMWDYRSRAYFLLAEMECWKDMWGQPFDLTPSPTTFETFLRDELVPSIKVF